MTDCGKLYNGITKAIWGFIFLYFDINFGAVSILPSFVGYILFLSAIRALQEEERELSLLRTIGILLTIWHFAKWVASLFSIDISKQFGFLTMIIGLINLYFHFQFLTNIASIAAKMQPEDDALYTRLLKLRTAQTVMLTCMLVCIRIFSWHTEVWVYISFALGAVYIIVSISIMRALWLLRRCVSETARVVT